MFRWQKSICYIKICLLPKTGTDLHAFLGYIQRGKINEYKGLKHSKEFSNKSQTFQFYSLLAESAILSVSNPFHYLFHYTKSIKALLKLFWKPRESIFIS